MLSQGCPCAQAPAEPSDVVVLGNTDEPTGGEHLETGPQAATKGLL